MLKAEAQVEHCRSVAASLKEQRENQRSELGQLQSRTGEIERDTQHARDRIRELEGEAAALKSEADGKARGQSDLQTRSLTLTQELSQLTAGLAARSVRPPPAGWRNWSACAGIWPATRTRAGP